MNDDKRRHREEKREIKRAGHKHARNRIKRAITESPDDADTIGDDFGRHRSVEMNGIDRDSTRRRPGDQPDDTL